ncbi:Rv3212 family protein [Corynebacterium macclintockiae]|uniref:Rv3212 family protein n=1 Tax=Corynebacterium macclintockiae TaxID=2913501 RepID=UPI003EBE5EE1
MSRRFPSPERARRSDHMAAAALVAGALALGGITWLGSDARNVDHRVANQPISASDKTLAKAGEDNNDQQIPQQLHELWSAQTDSPDLVVDQGGVVLTADSKTTMVRGDNGEEVWHYDAPEKLCGVAANWEKTNLFLHGPKGCGQVVALDSSTGEYRHTRDMLASNTVALFQSRDSIGMLAPSRTELLRYDLVRTVEVGEKKTSVKPNKQKYLECTFTSALTRKELLATAQTCPDKNTKLVRLLKTKPEDSDVPEEFHEYEVPAGSELVGISVDRAVIYVPGNGIRAKDEKDNKGSRFQILDKQGKFKQIPADPAPLLDPHKRQSELFSAQTADSAHAMSWFDGKRVVAFKPSTMEPKFQVEGAIGPAAPMGGRLLIPMQKGIGVVDWSNGALLRTIPVDRKGYTGPVTLRLAGDVLVEKRGKSVVALGRETR